MGSKAARKTLTATTRFGEGGEMGTGCWRAPPRLLRFLICDFVSLFASCLLLPVAPVAVAAKGVRLDDAAVLSRPARVLFPGEFSLFGATTIKSCASEAGFSSKRRWVGPLGALIVAGRFGGATGVAFLNSSYAVFK